MNRRFRALPFEELLLAHLAPGFLLAVGWTVMYEVYHEDGSYYTTLMQEILSTEGLFPYFILSAILMAFPLGLIVDTVRQVVGEGWMGVPRRHGDKVGRDPALDWLGRADSGSALSTRYLLYRHARATVLAPAKAAGNTAVVLLVFLAWFVVKIVRIQGWTVFSLAFIIGTPLIGLGLVAVLFARYTAGLRDFSGALRQLDPAAAGQVPEAAGMPGVDPTPPACSA